MIIAVTLPNMLQSHEGNTEAFSDQDTGRVNAILSREKCVLWYGKYVSACEHILLIVRQVKAIVALAYAMNAYIGIRGIALLILNCSTRWR